MTTIDRYRILRQLGSGGCGRTYLAEHAVLRVPAVIKQSLFDDDSSRARFLEEARLLYEVRHWGLPHVKDVILRESGEVLIVSSYIPGEDLMQHVARSGPLEAEDGCWIAQRVLAALHYLHFVGIIHCDVKPANIIAQWDTHCAVLVDFGLACHVPRSGARGSGYTPAFCAPEQREGKPVVPETDIYGLGMTMVHLLGGDIHTLEIPEHVPGPLRDFVRRCVRIDVRERPSSANELNEELGTIRQRVFGRAHSR